MPKSKLSKYHRKARRMVAYAIDRLVATKFRPGNWGDKGDSETIAHLYEIRARVIHGAPEPGKCCEWEQRNELGWCINCDDSPHKFEPV